MDYRIIHTELYTEKAEKVLKAVHKYMQNYWGSTKMRRNADLAKVIRQPNGEVVWQIDKEWSYNRSTYATRKDDSNVRWWLSYVLKQAVVRDGNKWSRKNNEHVSHLSRSFYGDLLPNLEDRVTVAEAYCVYDNLLGRKKNEKKYAKGFYKSIVGEELDEVQTQLEIVRREELAKIEQKYKSDKQDLDNKAYYEAIEEKKKVQDAINEKYGKLKTDLELAYIQAKKDLEQSMSFAANI